MQSINKDIIYISSYNVNIVQLVTPRKEFEYKEMLSIFIFTPSFSVEIFYDILKKGLLL